MGYPCQCGCGCSNPGLDRLEGFCTACAVGIHRKAVRAFLTLAGLAAIGVVLASLFLR